MRRIITQDYTSKADLNNSDGLQWMQKELATIDMFDPA
jgi:hypothetical protein